MRIYVRCLGTAVALLVAAAGWREAGAADVGRLGSLIDRLSASPDDGNAKKDIERICFEASRPGAEAERAAASKALLSKLGPQVSADARAFALRQLERIGRAEVVSGLSQILSDTDARVRDCARRALQNNPSPDAGKALAKALENAKDEAWRVALINAIGGHGDEDAAGSLVALLDGKDDAVAVAAAAALGRTGGSDAAKALSSAMGKGSAEFRVAVADAYLSCADRFLSDGRLTEATAIYTKLHSAQGSKLFKIAGMQGLAAVQAAKAAGVKEVAATPSSPSRPSAKAPAGNPTVDPEVLAKWDKRLISRAEASVKAGKKPVFRLTSMRMRVKVVGASAGGGLKVSAQGMQLSVPVARLMTVDKKNLAAAVAGSDPAGNAIAAFYCLVLGDRSGSGVYLRKAGKLADEVRKAFE